jgi:glucose-1-phosphate thymidylyltransferase
MMEVRMPGLSGARPPLGVILNGGLGTRLQPITPELPKALVPVANRPLIDYSIEYLLSLGIREIAIVVRPDDEASGARALEVAPSSVPISVVTQAEANGIGGAVTAVGAALDGRTVAVLAADTLLLGDQGGYIEEFEAANAAAGLVLAPVEDPRSFGVAVLEGARVVDLEEKPAEPRSNLALVGLWLLGPDAVEEVRARPFINAKGESDLTATIARMLSGGKHVVGWETQGTWLDAGTVEGLLGIHSRMLQELEPGDATLAEGCTTEGVVSVGRGVTALDSRLVGPVLIGNEVHVVGSQVRQSVIGHGAVLRDCQLERCVVLPGAQLEGVRYRDVVITRSGQIGGPGAP